MNAVSPVDPQNKRGNIANCHDRLKQIPVSSAVFAVDCVVSRTVIQLFTYDLVTHVLSCYTQIVKVWFCPEVIQCGLQDIKIQTLTNQKEALKRKRNLHNIKNNRTTC